MIRILHLADLHLGYLPPWKEAAESRRRERDIRLSAAVDWALAHGVDLVLIAGDLFETHRPPASLVNEVIRQLERLEGAGIPVVTLPGNHDEISYHDSVYRTEQGRWPGRLVTNPHMDRAVTLTCRGHEVSIYSLAYTSGVTRADRPLAHFPPPDGAGIHIALLHGSLDWGRERSLPIDGRALEAAGYHYAALGHIHRHEVRGRERPVVYAGIIDGKDFDDPGTGHYVVAEVDEQGAVVRREPADGVRPLVSVELDAGGYESLAQLEEDARGLVPEGAAVRLTLSGTPAYPVHPERVKAALAGRAFYLEVVDETRGLADELIEALAREPTVRGAFVQRMLERLRRAAPGEERTIRRALVRGLEAMGWEGPSG